MTIIEAPITFLITREVINFEDGEAEVEDEDSFPVAIIRIEISRTSRKLSQEPIVNILASDAIALIIGPETALPGLFATSVEN